MFAMRPGCVPAIAGIPAQAHKVQALTVPFPTGGAVAQTDGVSVGGPGPPQVDSGGEEISATQLQG